MIHSLALRAIGQGKKYAISVLVSTLAITLYFLSALPSLRFDYDFEAFFPNEDRELEFYNGFRETFEYDNEFILLAAENRDGIFRREFLVAFDSLAALLSRTDGITRVQSPTRLHRLDLRGLIPVKVPLMHIDDPGAYQADSAAIYSDPSLAGSFFPADAKSLSLFAATRPGLSKAACDTLAQKIGRTVALFDFDEVRLAGRIFAQKEYLDQLRREFVLFICISLIVVMAFLWLSFRNARGVLIPLTVVMLSIIWTLGLMALLGKPIDILTTMLPTMIFITGMSDVVHFFSKYFDLHAEGRSPREIMKVIFREVAFPTFLTLITTVVAFLSLLFSSIKPVREFGIYTSVGITFAFILSYTFLPALLHFVDPARVIRHDRPARLTGIMRSLMFAVFRGQRLILAVTTLLAAVAVAGITRIEVNNTLLEDLSEEIRVKQDFLFFDKHYRGARPLEMQITNTGEGSLLDYEKMKAIYRVDSFIREMYDPGFLVTPASIVMELARSRGLEAGSFPAKEEYEAIRHELDRNSRNAQLKRYLAPGGQLARISGKIRDLGSKPVGKLDAAFSAFTRSAGEAAGMRFQITGAAHLIDRNNSYMVENMLQGFAFSVVTIALLTFLLHRSWRMVLVFIIPNVLPLLLIGGIMGFAGIELKAATSIIFSIAFGIATDDTIHFISRFRVERSYGKSLLYAFKRTYFDTGRPIALTTFILLGGFLSLMTSDFQSTFYFGLLTCVTIVIALAADLLLLPVLLFLLYKKQ